MSYGKESIKEPFLYHENEKYRNISVNSKLIYTKNKNKNVINTKYTKFCRVLFIIIIISLPIFIWYKFIK
jgi:hypothetical protein